MNDVFCSSQHPADRITFPSAQQARPRRYDDIKALAKATGRKIPDLLAMACTNDPFYIMPSQTRHGEWFAKLWTQFDLPNGIHLRRIHYKLVSQSDPVFMVGGRPYQNTENCWQYLSNASKAARCLSLVAADAFQDKRNPDALIVRDYKERLNPWIDLEFSDWSIPEINADLADRIDWSFPEIEIGGYLPGDTDQPFHLELISEKSTVDDVIIPLCESLRINYAPATGFQSITGIIGLLQRLRHAKKPGIVFYVSDFDPAGSFMPPAVARQIEFWLPKYAPGLDVLLLPIALTQDQVKEHSLPPIPIKETDRRQAGFLEKYGVEGATELDALEALHPGALAQIIRRSIAPYRDNSIDREIFGAGDHAVDCTDPAWSEVSEEHRQQLKQLKARTAGILRSYQTDLTRLRDSMQLEIEPIKRDLESLRLAIKNKFVELECDLPDRPKSSLSLPSRFDGLFDSRRGYLDQIAFYKATMEGAAQ